MNPIPHTTDCVLRVVRRERLIISSMMSPSGTVLDLRAVDPCRIPATVLRKIGDARMALFDLPFYPDCRPDEELYFLTITRSEALALMELIKENA